MKINLASFRDPSANVYEQGNRVFRLVNNDLKEFCGRFLSSDFYRNNRKIKIVETNFVNSIVSKKIQTPKNTFWLEHERIEFITYPHEWGFCTLKKAALFHLQLQIEAISEGFMLKDASAYNVQLKNGEPIFIDLLSFEDYQDGAFWAGYNQFCNNFLNPLLVRSFTGVEHNQFFRGSIDGVDSRLASNLLPLKSWFSFTTLSHVHLKSWAEQKADATSSKLLEPPKSGIPLKNLVALWKSLASFISKLVPRDKTYWADYPDNTSYSDVSENVKGQVLSDFISKNKFQTVIDLGCNSGRYSRIALENGAQRVIGLDFDGSAVDKANSDTFLQSQNFIALQYDFMNPSPAIGWRNRERSMLIDRLPKINAILCFALIHHICITKNVPLGNFVEFLFSLSDFILVEFVPKTDPMVMGLLSHRVDVFSDYNEENFKTEVLKFGKILNTHNIEGSTRKVFICQSK